jgi:hypothetical protein
VFAHCIGYYQSARLRRDQELTPEAFSAILLTFAHSANIPTEYRLLWLVEEAREELAITVLSFSRASIGKRLYLLWRMYMLHRKLRRLTILFTARPR